MESANLSRRGAFRLATSLAALSSLELGLGQLAYAAEAIKGDGPADAPKRSWYEFRMLEDHVLEQILAYYLGLTYCQMSDIGECFDAANRVVAGDDWTWPRAWESTASRLRKMAEESEAAGHRISAGHAYLRSCNYYIAALHRHPDPKHASVRQWSQAALDCYRKAVAHLSLPVEEVAIPYENTTLPGYFYRANVKGKAPTLMVFNGRDAWAMQGKYLAEEGNRRGYHVLLFEGPGQGQVLRLQNLAFRPDWEKVVTPAVDFTLKLKGVDPDRIGVMGISMGGVLAPRAAAFEHRPKVYVVNPPSVNWAEVAEVAVGQMVGKDGLALVDTNPAAFNAMMLKVMEQVPLAKWGMDDMFWKHGVTTPADVLLELRKYNMADVIPKIRSKMLMITGVDDEWAQVDRFRQLLKAPSDLITFDKESTGQLHCQGGAAAILCQRLYDWLDGNLRG